MSAIAQMNYSYSGAAYKPDSDPSKKDVVKEPAVDPLANKATFLQLLVAQLKNQDPESPADGAAFVTQLAQFSTLENSLASRQDLDAIAKSLDTLVGNTTATEKS